MPNKKLPTVNNANQGKAAYILMADAAKSPTEIARAIEAFDIIPHNRQTAYAGTNSSVRDQMTRRDYEYFRPSESIPEDPQEKISACMNAYSHVGLVRNVIDLMADFGAQGVKLVHPNPRKQKFYRALWKKWNGPERTERALNLLYRCGMFVAKRRTAKINVQMEAKMTAQGEDGLITPDAEMENDLKITRRTIPIRYVFMNPLMLSVIGGELAQFVGEQYYAIKINLRLRQLLSNKDTLTIQLVSRLPSEIKSAIQSGATALPLDPDKIVVRHYKKDDWQQWAEPMIFPLLDDLLIYQKMKLADLAALDGAISQVRLWSLGDIDKGMFPNQAAVNRLVEILMSNPGGGAFDIVWGPDLKLHDYDTNVHKFLGGEKYKPIKESIYEGLGVPSTLTGGGSGGMTNNYMSLQTLIKRLEYGRSVVKSFWEGELELVRQAMGHRQAPSVVFDHMILSDEASVKALLIQLADRDVLSVDTLSERFGEDPDIEQLKIRREMRLRKQGLMNDKASPWHAPEKIFQYLKLAIAGGYVDLRETGWEPEIEDVNTPLKQQLDNQKEIAKTKGIGLPGGAVKKKQPGQTSPGRPKNAVDKQKRKARSPKPLGASLAYDFLAKMVWAREAQARISDIVTPGLLEHYGKKNQRALTQSESDNLEYFKFSVLSNMKPFTDVTSNIVSDLISSYGTLKVDNKMDVLYHKLLVGIRTQNDREPTIEEVRMTQAAAFSMSQEEEIIDG